MDKNREERARLTGEAGDYAEARRQYLALLAEYERVLGRDHPDTLRARASVARWTGEAGDRARARGQLHALLPVMERVLGREHSDTLNARRVLGANIAVAGDWAAARAQLQALLPVVERVLGREHPDTLRTRLIFAGIAAGTGDPAGARGQLQALLPVVERVLGREHPDTLRTRRNLAQVTGAAGDPAGARGQLQALLPVVERVLGREHPDTLRTHLVLAVNTSGAGDPAGARRRLQALLPVMERVLGRRHPETISVRDIIGLTSEIAGPGLSGPLPEGRMDGSWLGGIKNWQRKARRTSLTGFALASGLSYSESDLAGRLAAVRVTDFPWSGQPVRFSYENVLSGQWKGLPVTGADCLVVTHMLGFQHITVHHAGSAVIPKHHMMKNRFSVAIAGLPAALPGLLIQSTTPRTGAREGFRYRVAPGSAEFSRRFQATTSDTAFAAKLLDASMISWLLSAGPAFMFKLDGRDLLLVWSHLLPASSLASLFDTAKGFTGHIPHQVWAEHGTR